MKLFLSAFFCFNFILAIAQETGISYWKEHLPYKKAIGIAELDSTLYIATNFSVYTFNLNEMSVKRLSKVNSLSDIGIGVLRKNTYNNQLFIGYTNGNIDLIENNTVYNIPDFKNEQIIGEKTIHDVYFKSDIAYLSTSFGVLELDCRNKEFLNTFYLTSDANLTVYDLSFFQDSIYAITDSGTYVSKTSLNLSDFHNWKKSSSETLNKAVAIECIQDDCYILTNEDSLISFTQKWFNAGYIENFRGFTYSDHKMHVLGNKELYTIENEGVEFLKSIERSVRLNGLYKNSKGYWLADEVYSLVFVGEDNDWHLIPESPNSELVFSLTHHKEKLYVSPGGITTTWNNNNIWEGFYWNDDYEWSRVSSSLIDYTKDITNIVPNPNNRKEVFLGSWNRGVLKLVWNETNYDLDTIYNFTNTNGALEPISNDSSSNVYGWIRIKGMAFDNDGNLWMANSQVENAIVVKTPSDDWISYKVNSYNTIETHLGSLVIDDFNQKWIIIPKGGGLLVFDDKGSLENVFDDEDKTLSTAVGNGALPSKDIYSLAKDRDGEIWVGTNKGIAVFYSPENVFSGYDFDAQQILVEVDGYVENLLANETVTAIAVDGANRKWLGTQSAGVFLVSPDGTEQIHHFTEENSPLFSNTITDIAINHQTGEVYIGTSKGLLSYMSDATQGYEIHQKVSVYPNPVRPEFNGIIAIKGLVEDADVKITDLNGTLVYETTALGGQAVWDGKNGYGVRVRTGVYLVFSSNSFGTETNVAKILFIH